jgi:hypothetical protein
MNRPSHQPLPPSDDSWESDELWKLLDHASAVEPGPRFAADTLRAARLDGARDPWWKAWFAPAPLTGLATAAAAVALTFLALNHRNAGNDSRIADTPEPVAENSLASIQEFADAELLNAAVDHLDDFSDHELVSLIGF